MSVITMHPATALPATLEVLTFHLGPDEYGIDIQKVQELRGYASVTRIANAPDHLLGVINLRGVVVPIIDLRLRFGLGDPRYDQFTVVVILTLAQGVMGMVVDSVSDVRLLSGGQIKPAPQLGTALDASYLIGIGALDQRMLQLLDIDRLMAGEDQQFLAQLRA